MKMNIRKKIQIGGIILGLGLEAIIGGCSRQFITGPLPPPSIGKTSTPVYTSTITLTDTDTATPTNTSAVPYTPTNTSSFTPTSTLTTVPYTPTPSNTGTFTDTDTLTPVNTPTNTSSFTPTSTLTTVPYTPTPSSTSTGTNTLTPVNTPTNTLTFTGTNTSTPTSTSTNTETPTNSLTFTYTPTSTNTSTPTNTSTNSPTPTETNTPTNTNSPTSTFTPTFTPVPRVGPEGTTNGFSTQLFSSPIVSVASGSSSVFGLDKGKYEVALFTPPSTFNYTALRNPPFFSAMKIAVNSGGNYEYVADNGTIYSFVNNSQATPSNIGTFTNGGPTGLAVDGNSNIVTGDGSVVRVFTSSNTQPYNSDLGSNIETIATSSLKNFIKLTNNTLIVTNPDLTNPVTISCPYTFVGMSYDPTNNRLDGATTTDVTEFDLSQLVNSLLPPVSTFGSTSTYTYADVAIDDGDRAFVAANEGTTPYILVYNRQGKP